MQAQPGETLSWRLTRLERDRLGRLVRKHLPDGQVHHFQHDPSADMGVRSPLNTPDLGALN